MNYPTLLQHLTTPFYIPPHAGSGDRDFDGHGPKVDASVTLRLSNDAKHLIAKVYLRAIETKNDWTRCEGTGEFSVFTCKQGQTIASLDGITSEEVTYTDKDWDEDFVVNSAGERTPQADADWSLSDAQTTGLTRFYRFVGDTNGPEAGTRTGVQVFFNPVKLTLKGSPIDEVKLDVPYVVPCGNNTCGSAASTALLRYYGVDISCDAMKKRIEASGNFVNLLHSVTGAQLGVDPNTLRDRMNELSNQFSLRQINDASVIDFIKHRLDEGSPVLVLTGWGSKTIRDWYCRSDDSVSLNPNSTLHYMVVDGYSRQTDVFYLVDNGSRKYQTETYLKNAILWHPQNFIVEGALYANQVQPGKVIWGEKTRK